MAEFTEKRMFPRVPVDTGVQLPVGEGSGGFWCTVSDISFGGCYVYTFSPLPLGQDVGLTIKANGVEINVTGRIVSSPPGVGMGIAFNGFSQKDGEQSLKTHLNHPASLPQTTAGSGVVPLTPGAGFPRARRSPAPN